MNPQRISNYMSKDPCDSLLVYLGANAQKELVQQLLSLNSGICFLESAIYPERSFSIADDEGIARSVVPFDAALVGNPGEIRFTPISGCNRVDIIESIMSDKLLPLLWTRFNGKTRWCNKSEVKRYEVTYSLVKSALETCNALTPESVLFSYEPHMLPIYIFKKVCEALGIRTYTLTISPFVWRLFLETTNCRQAEALCCTSGGATSDDSVTRFINEKKSDYSVAKPFYEKRNVSLRVGKRHFDKLKLNGWKLHRFIPSQMAFANYHKLCTNRRQLEGTRYIAIFLQLQPEQTTLPDGGLFVHHLFAIQMLYAAVSALGISLVIREHPATFEYAYDSKWRPADFYRSIKNIGAHIHFDDISQEPYSLIRNAVAVSAITGTVLLEALLHGRPAIAFGKHPLRGYSGTALVDSFADEIELREKISKAADQSPGLIIEDTEKYLNQVYPTTFGGQYPGNGQMSLDKLRETRYTAVLQVVNLLLQDGGMARQQPHEF